MNEESSLITNIMIFVVLLHCIVAQSSSLPNVLLCHGELVEKYVNDIRDKLLQTARFSSVSAINCSASTPTVALLMNFSSVMVWSNAPFQQPITLGDNLVRIIIFFSVVWFCSQQRNKKRPILSWTFGCCWRHVSLR